MPSVNDTITGNMSFNPYQKNNQVNSGNDETNGSEMLQAFLVKNQVDSDDEWERFKIKKMRNF